MSTACSRPPVRKRNVGQGHPFAPSVSPYGLRGTAGKHGSLSGYWTRTTGYLGSVVGSFLTFDIFIRKAGKGLAVHVNGEKDIAKEQPIVENGLESKGVDNACNDLVSAPTSKTTAPE